MYKINRDVFEIVDSNYRWRNTYRVNGELIFFRLILKRKKTHRYTNGTTRKTK